LFKDGFVQTLTKHLAYDTQDYQPTITFVNSEYYGIFNIRERFDEKYFERVYNINEDDIEILESQGIADPGDDVFLIKCYLT
jgi:CotH protein.